MQKKEKMSHSLSLANRDREGVFVVSAAGTSRRSSVWIRRADVMEEIFSFRIRMKSDEKKQAETTEVVSFFSLVKVQSTIETFCRSFSHLVSLCHCVRSSPDLHRFHCGFVSSSSSPSAYANIVLHLPLAIAHGAQLPLCTLNEKSLEQEKFR